MMLSKEHVRPSLTSSNLRKRHMKPPRLSKYWAMTFRLLWMERPRQEMKRMKLRDSWRRFGRRFRKVELRWWERGKLMGV